MKKIAVKPTGNSMLPFIRPNDTVYLICDCRNIKKYDVVLYQAYGVSVLHRVIGEEKNRYIICGDNTAVIEKIPKNKIAAKAVELERRGRVISLNNRALNIMVRIWYGLGLKKTARFAKRKINKIQR